MKTWSNEEIEILKRHFPCSTKEEISALLPCKSYLAIYKKSRTLNLKRTDEAKHLNAKESRTKIYFAHKPLKKKGYVLIYMPHHPRADANGRVLEHIVVWERANGMIVPDGYVIHHKNGIKDDNREENLELMKRTEHIVHHNSRRKLSSETKSKISRKTKERLADKRNHPRFKDIDICEIERQIRNGMKVKDACAKFGIGRTTYYEKLKEVKI